VLRFVEDNWLSGTRIQAGGSFDTIAGPLTNMFSFPAASGVSMNAQAARKLFLDPATGNVSP
jgi:hypothetical protein